MDKRRSNGVPFVNMLTSKLNSLTSLSFLMVSTYHKEIISLKKRTLCDVIIYRDYRQVYYYMIYALYMFAIASSIHCRDVNSFACSIVHVPMLY